MHASRAGSQHRAEPGIGAQQRRTRDAHTHTATLRAEGQGHEHRQRGAAGITIDQLTLYRLKALLPSAWSISSSWTASSEYIATLMSVVFLGMFRVCHPALRVMPTPLVGHVVAGSRLNNNPSPPHVHAGWPLASCLFGWVTSHSVCSDQAMYTRSPQHSPRCMHLSNVKAGYVVADREGEGRGHSPHHWASTRRNSGSNSGQIRPDHRHRQTPACSAAAAAKSAALGSTISSVC